MKIFFREEVYKYKQREAAKKHQVIDGQYLDIIHQGGLTEADQKRYRVRVVYISPYYVTLKFKKGYCVSMPWEEFEEARMKAELERR